MWRTSAGSVSRRSIIRAFAVTAAIALGALGAGCSTGVPVTTGSVASAPAPRGATIAFESIDGMPQYQFQSLVRSLEQEAETRQLAFVSRTAPAQYHVRGYASAQVRNKRTTTIVWVWDVYDSAQERTLRLTGEQPGANGRRGWAAADDQVIRSIAKDGVTQLTGLLTGPQEPAPPAVSPPSEAAPAVASAETPTQHAALVTSY
jgi:hypothetical protein